MSSSTTLNHALAKSQANRPSMIGSAKIISNDFRRWCKDNNQPLSKKGYRAFLDKHPETKKGSYAATIRFLVSEIEYALEGVKVDRIEIVRFVDRLLIEQTLFGQGIQDYIIVELAKLAQSEWRGSTTAEESKGIDGYLNNLPISIKPKSYDYSRAKKVEAIDVPLVKYELFTGDVEMWIHIDPSLRQPLNLPAKVTLPTFNLAGTP